MDCDTNLCAYGIQNKYLKMTLIFWTLQHPIHQLNAGIVIITGRCKANWGGGGGGLKSFDFDVEVLERSKLWSCAKYLALNDD